MRYFLAFCCKIHGRQSVTVKSFVLICFAFVLGAAASAQEYSIRVKFNTNLRATYSLDGRIVDTALAGTTLSVTGSQEKWLMIDRSGRAVWMADWVPLTRVEGGPVPSDIDNCCFVDRQCNSNHEWTNGYWAYQNNQCRAPAHPAPLTSPQPVNSTPANVDNCCFVDRHCTSDHEWTAGYWAYQNNQCGASGNLWLGVQVEGSTGFLHMVERAFQLLKEWAPDWYTYVTSALHKVRQEPDSPNSGIYIDSRTFGVGSRVQTADEVTLLRRR